MARYQRPPSPSTSHIGRYRVSSGANSPVSTRCPGNRGNRGNRGCRRRGNRGRRRGRGSQENQANRGNNGNRGGRRSRGNRGRRSAHIRQEILERPDPEDLIWSLRWPECGNEPDSSIYPDHWSPGHSPRQYTASEGHEGYVSQAYKILR